MSAERMTADFETLFRDAQGCLAQYEHLLDMKRTNRIKAMVRTMKVYERDMPVMAGALVFAISRIWDLERQLANKS